MNFKMYEKSKNLRYPSLGEITFLDERSVIFSRPSFHSDPIPHNYESDMDSGLTRSLDTGNLNTLNFLLSALKTLNNF